MQSWLEGRNWVGKCAQATGMTASLRILSSKADSNTWESFTRSGLKLESVYQDSPHSDIFRKRATKPLLKQKDRQKHLTWAKEKKNWTVAQWSKVLFSDKSQFCFSFENQGLEEDWRGTESMLLEVQREVSEVSDDLGCRDVCWCPLCFLKSKVNAAVYQEILEHFMLPSADKLYGDADFLFQQDFSISPQCQSTSKCIADHDITVLDWPDNMPDLNSIWNLWDIFKRKMRNSRSNNSDELKSQRCHRLIASMPHLTDAGICAKVHKWTYFKELEFFCFANPFFYWS